MNDLTYKNRIAFHDCEIVNDMVYFSALNYNGLYRYGIHDKRLKFLGYFPDEKLTARHIHSGMKYVEGKLYLAPMNGEYLSIYDIEKDTFTSIPLKSGLEGLRTKFYNIQLYKRKIILIPSRYNYIVTYDIDSGKTEFHDEWNKCVNLDIKQDIPMVKNGSFIKESRLYIPYCREPLLLEIDLENYDARAVRIGKGESGFTDAIFSAEENKVFFLKNGECSIVEMNCTDNKTTEYKFETEKKYEYPFTEISDLGDTILIAAYQNDYSLIFNKNTHAFSKINLEDSDKDVKREWDAYHYDVISFSDTKKWLINTGDYRIVQFDKDAGVSGIFFLEDDLKEARDFKKRKGNILKESQIMGLEEFIRLL